MYYEIIFKMVNHLMVNFPVHVNMSDLIFKLVFGLYMQHLSAVNNEKYITSIRSQAEQVTIFILILIGICSCKMLSRTLLILYQMEF